jgi:hypothetical protein
MSNNKEKFSSTRIDNKNNKDSEIATIGNGNSGAQRRYFQELKV